MGTCTSSIKRRQKQHRQRNKRRELQTTIVYDNKHLSPVPFTVLRNQRPRSLLTNLNIQASALVEPTVSRPETRSLIQLCSSNTNNSMSNVPPRIPVPKSRLPIHQSQSSSSGSIRPKQIPSAMSPTGNTQ